MAFPFEGGISAFPFDPFLYTTGIHNISVSLWGRFKQHITIFDAFSDFISLNPNKQGHEEDVRLYAMQYWRIKINVFEIESMTLELEISICCYQEIRLINFYVSYLASKVSFQQEKLQPGSIKVAIVQWAV